MNEENQTALSELYEQSVKSVKEGEIVVALNGGALGIGKVRDPAGAKIDAIEFAANTDLKVGMRFGS